jgi:hypothetical protein
MRPGEKKPMPAGIEDLADVLVARVREYERNCRCPKCHGHMASGRSGPLQCVDCDFCLANLRKLMLGELGSSIFFPERERGGSQPVASEDFACVPERIGGNLLAMKPKTRKTKLAAKAAGSKTAKAKSKAKPKSKIGKAAPARKAPKVTARKAVGKKAAGKKAVAKKAIAKKPAKKTVAKARPLVKAGHAASDAGRIGVFVRFETAADKELAAKAADVAKANSLSAYSAHFALEAAQAGKKMELKPRAVPPQSREKGEKKPSEGSSEYDRRNFTRFANPTQKGIVAKAAKATGVSLSAYIVHFTMEAARAKAKLPEKEQEPETATAATGT